MQLDYFTVYIIITNLIHYEFNTSLDPRSLASGRARCIYAIIDPFILYWIISSYLSQSYYKPPIGDIGGWLGVCVARLWLPLAGGPEPAGQSRRARAGGPEAAGQRRMDKHGTIKPALVARLRRLAPAGLKYGPGKRRARATIKVYPPRLVTRIKVDKC